MSLRCRRSPKRDVTFMTGSAGGTSCGLQVTKTALASLFGGLFVFLEFLFFLQGERDFQKQETKTTPKTWTSCHHKLVQDLGAYVLKAGPSYKLKTVQVFCHCSSPIIIVFFGMF